MPGIPRTSYSTFQPFYCNIFHPADIYLKYVCFPTLRSHHEASFHYNFIICPDTRYWDVALQTKIDTRNIKSCSSRPDSFSPVPRPTQRCYSGTFRKTMGIWRKAPIYLSTGHIADKIKQSLRMQRKNTRRVMFSAGTWRKQQNERISSLLPQTSRTTR